MAVITTGSYPKLLWPGLKKLFGTAYNEKPMMCDRIFPEYSSDKAYEEYQELTGFGLAATKPEGAAISYDTQAQGYTARLRNVTRALGGMVTMEAIQDNQYEQMGGKIARGLARAQRITKETVFASILNGGFTGTDGGDGVSLFSDAHPTLSGTQANEPTVAADLSEASLEDAVIAIKDFRDSRGIRIEARPEQLIVPTELMFTAHRILNSDLRVGTGNNDTNAMKDMGVFPEPMVWDYLTDADTWFIKTDVDEGLIRQERMAPQLEQDNDFDTKNARMSTVARYAAGWADWRGAYGVPGA